MLRGGSWNNKPRNCRAANRNNNDPDNRNNNIGFRVCSGTHIVIIRGGRPRRHRKFRPTTVCRTRPGRDRRRRQVPSAGSQAPAWEPGP
ncbi:MAG: SUMF1/EgtB/PvdO family nonheme iron enzyme [Pseudomonadota bacterium]|nr:SUMF1/EgtB/PvdO family nonheme iron enzyme [Pseudomonadota bacterium]